MNYRDPQGNTDSADAELDLREEVRALLEADQRLSQNAIAKESDVSAATISQWLSNAYAGNNQKVEGKVRAWLDAYRERQASGGLPQAPKWIETPSSLRVIAGLRYAQMAGDIVVIYGGAGTGKSSGIEQYARVSPRVFSVTVTPATSGVLAILEEIATAVGLRDWVRSSSGLQRAIVPRLKGTNGLLVLDEAQHLGILALDQVRALHDLAGIGIALVGNERVYTNMTGGNRAAYLDRLFSRIGKRIALKKTTEGDVDKIVEAWGIKDRECRRQIAEIATKPGALRVLTKVLRLAASYAQADSRSLCCDDVRAAWQELGGIE
jgi:DNA transposition AAA+ family ATPase